MTNEWEFLPSHVVALICEPLTFQERNWILNVFPMWYHGLTVTSIWRHITIDFLDCSSSAAGVKETLSVVDIIDMFHDYIKSIKFVYDGPPYSLNENVASKFVQCLRGLKICNLEKMVMGNIIYSASSSSDKIYRMVTSSIKEFLRSSTGLHEIDLSGSYFSKEELVALLLLVNEHHSESLTRLVIKDFETPGLEVSRLFNYHWMLEKTKSLRCISINISGLDKAMLSSLISHNSDFNMLELQTTGILSKYKVPDINTREWNDFCEERRSLRVNWTFHHVRQTDEIINQLEEGVPLLKFAYIADPFCDPRATFVLTSHMRDLASYLANNFSNSLEELDFEFWKIAAETLPQAISILVSHLAHLKTLNVKASLKKEKWQNILGICSQAASELQKVCLTVDGSVIDTASFQIEASSYYDLFKRRRVFLRILII